MKDKKKIARLQDDKVSRRDFMSGAVAAAAFTIVPRHVLARSGGTPPSEKLNIAGIGIGGMGRNNVNACKSENIVALCDVDDEYAAKIFNEYPKAKKYRDFRIMLEKQKGLPLEYNKVGKKYSGNLLDGVKYEEYPDGK